MSDDLSLVPADRLGALLAEQRTRHGLTIEELRARAELGFSADEIRQIERGQRALSDEQINRLTMAYRLGTGEIVPERSELVIDLHHGAVFAGQHTRILPAQPEVDDVLGRYMSLLYLMRGMEPGREVALRGDDLDVLAGALERSIAEVEQQLFNLMLPGGAAPWYRRMRHRLAVPVAGIVVGLTSVGTLVFVQLPDGQRGDLSPIALDLGSAIERPDPGGPLAVEDAELAPAVTQLRDDSPTSIGAAAAALIDYPFEARLPGWDFVYAGPRVGVRGNTNTVTRTVTVYVEPADSPEIVAAVLAHEIGHALDVMYLDDDARARWQTERGLADQPWWPTETATDIGLGAGDFAEGVAALLTGSSSTAVEPPFTAANLNTIAELIAARDR